MPKNELDVLRRDVLKAAGAATLAPAASAVASSPATAAESQSLATSTSGVVTGAIFQDTHLYVLFEAPDTVDYAVLINPNGQQRAKTKVQRGETSAAFRMYPKTPWSQKTEPYKQGTYKLYAYRSRATGDDSQVGMAEIEIPTPSLAVTGFKSLNGSPPWIVFRNAGSIPIALTQISLVSGVPSPGGFNAETVGFDGGKPYFLNPGVTDVIEYTSDLSSPMQASSKDAVPCGETREVKVSVKTQLNGKLSDTISVNYTGERKSVSVGFGEEYYCTRVTGGEFP